VPPIPGSVRRTDRSFLERLVAATESDGRVATLLLGGSHAAGTADAYSDLDLTLITTDDGFESLHAERFELLRGLGDPIFLEEHDDFGFLLLLFIYADGVCGEMSLAPARAVDDVVGGPNVALFDKGGVRAGQSDEGGLDAAARTGIVRRSLAWFWYHRRLLDVMVVRGRLWTAHHYLERCRELCLNLASMRDRPEVWPGGHEKADVLLRKETLERLAPTVVPLEKDTLIDAARAITDLYMEIGPEVAERCGVEFPAKLAASVSSRPPL
jgi:Streptomycin adenylyltransferase